MRNNKMYKVPVIVLAILGAVISLIINCVSLGNVVIKSMQNIVAESQYGDAWGDSQGNEAIDPANPGNGNSSEDSSDGTTQNDTGVDPSTEKLTDMESYQAEATTITYKTETYSLYKKINNSGKVYLNVQYPVLSGTNDTYTDTINKLLKDQAMVSADNYYLNVEGRSKVKAGADGMYIVSEVSYQVTYLSDDFISVVFEDRYCAGDYYSQYIDMRSCNIDLKTGTSYNLNQIVDADQNKAAGFEVRLDEKYQSVDVISDTPVKDYTSMMQGDTDENGSFMGFFRTREGIEIYYTFHYKSDTNSSVGWLTVPYNGEDLKTMQNQSDYWKIAQ